MYPTRSGRQTPSRGPRHIDSRRLGSMQNLPKPIRLLAPLVALIAAVVVVSGCGTTSPDIARGRVLFGIKCGVCHTLAAADTAGDRRAEPRRRLRRGPRSAASTRRRSKGSSRHRSTTRAPRTATLPPRCPPTPPRAPTSTTSPPTSASTPATGTKPPEAEGGAGEQVFAKNGCGGCHTLAAANSGGATGPDLDEVLPGQRKRKSKNRSSTRKRKSPRATRPASCPGNRTKNPEPEKLKAARQIPRANPPAKVPASERRPRSRSGHHLNMFASLRNRFEISPQRYAQVTAVALVGLGADRPHRRRGAAHRLGARLPGLAAVLRRRPDPALESHAIIE